MAGKAGKVRVIGTEDHRRTARRVPGGWLAVCSCRAWETSQPTAASRAAEAWLAHIDDRAAALGVQAELPPAPPAVDVPEFTVTCDSCGLSMQRGPYEAVPSANIAELIATRRGCPRCGGTLTASR